jgi:hypothetical protein
MNSNTKSPLVFELRDVEETEDAMRIREQLNRILSSS